MVWLFVFSVSGLILAMIFSSSRSSEFKLEFIVDSDWSESFGSSSDDCSSTTGSTIGCGVGVFLLFAGCGFADCNFFGDGLGETNFRDLARGFRPLLDGSFLVILRVLVRLAIGDCSVDLPCDSAVTTCNSNIKTVILEYFITSILPLLPTFEATWSRTRFDVELLLELAFDERDEVDAFLTLKIIFLRNSVLFGMYLLYTTFFKLSTGEN